MAINIKPEAVQLIGGILAFGPKALVISDLVADVIPPEVPALGYLLLTVGLSWEVIQMVRSKDESRVR